MVSFISLMVDCEKPVQQANAGQNDGQEEELIDRLANWITHQRLITPAVFLLEINKPFSFLGSQMLRVIQPLLGPALGYDQIGAYARLLEDRTNVERLLARLESHQAQDPAPTNDPVL